MSVSVYLVIDPLDDAVVRHAVIPVIEHRNDDVFMDCNADQMAGLNAVFESMSRSSGEGSTSPRRMVMSSV